MPIAVQCPSCGAKLNAPDKASGKRLPCPKCKKPLTVSAPAPLEEDALEEVEVEAVCDPEPASVRTRRRWLWWVAGGSVAALLAGILVIALLFRGPRGTPIASADILYSCKVGQRVVVSGTLSLHAGKVNVVCENLVDLRALFIMCEGMKAGEVAYSSGDGVLVSGVIADIGTLQGTPALILTDCTLHRGEVRRARQRELDPPPAEAPLENPRPPPK